LEASLSPHRSWPPRRGTSTWPRVSTLGVRRAPRRHKSSGHPSAERLPTCSWRQLSVSPLRREPVRPLWRLGALLRTCRRFGGAPSLRLSRQRSNVLPSRMSARYRRHPLLRALPLRRFKERPPRTSSRGLRPPRPRLPRLRFAQRLARRFPCLVRDGRRLSRWQRWANRRRTSRSPGRL